MPKIQGYTPQGRITAVGGSPSIAPNQLSIPQADPFQPLAQSLGDAARMSHALDMQKKKEIDEKNEYDARLHSINDMASLREIAMQNMQQGIESGDSSIEGFSQRQSAMLDKTIKNMRDAAYSPRAGQLFELQARQFQGDFFMKTLDVETKERISARVQNTSDAVRKESEYLLRNPGEYETIANNRLGAIDQMPLGTSAKAALKQQVSEHLSESVVRGVSLQNPSLALKMIDDGSFEKLPGFNLYGEKLYTLRKSIENELKSGTTDLQRQLAVDIPNQLADYSAGYTDRVLPKGYTLEQLKNTLSPTQWASYQSSVKSATSIRNLTNRIQFGKLPDLVKDIQAGQERYKVLEPYKDTIETAADKYGVDSGIIAAQIMAESAGNPGAVNSKTSTGKPSLGISQFQQATADQYGVDVNDPHSSIDGQAHYMADLLDQFGGDYAKALAAYNWGPSRVQKAVDKLGSGWQTALPKETQAYVNKILDTNVGGVSGVRATGAVAQALQKEASLRATDPATAAQRNMLAMDTRGQESLTLKEQLLKRDQIEKDQFGLPDQSRKLLTTAEAKSYVQQIKNAETMDQAQNVFGQIKQSIVGDNPTPADEALYTRVLGELYSHGLDKGYMFTDFVRSQVYGDMFTKALRTSSADAKEGLPTERQKEITDALSANEDYQSFLQVLAVTGGSAGGEYAGTFAKAFERTAYLAARNPSLSGADLVKSMTKDLITNQLTINGTYYVPAYDPVTHEPLDARVVDRSLRDIGQTWKKPDGSTFVPDVHTPNKYLSAAYTEQAVKDATNLAWITNESGTGVYRAIISRGAPGVFVPLTDAQGNRYSLAFSELKHMTAQMKETREKGRVPVPGGYMEMPNG